MGIANETDSVPVTTPAEDLGADVRTEQPPGPGPIGEVSDDHVSNILIPLGIIAILILLTAVVRAQPHLTQLKFRVCHFS